MNLLEKLLISPWFWVDVFLSISGGLIVAWGLSIEKKAEALLPPNEFRKDIFGDIVEKYKAEVERGWRILMAGIIIEVVATFVISVISSLEIADLTGQAADAKLQVMQIGTTNAQLVADNLVLRSNVATLESQADSFDKQLSPRFFSHLDTNFLTFAKKYSVSPTNSNIKAVIITDSQRECQELAFQIGDALRWSLNWKVATRVETNAPVSPNGITVDFFPGSGEFPRSENSILMNAAALDLLQVFNGCGVKAIWLDDINHPRGVIVITVGERPNKYDDEFFKSLLTWEDSARADLERWKKEAKTSIQTNH